MWVPDTVAFANPVKGYEPMQPLHSASVSLCAILMSPAQVLHLMRKVIDGNKWEVNRHYRPDRVDFPDSPEPGWSDPQPNGKDSGNEHMHWDLEAGSVHLFKEGNKRNRLGILTGWDKQDWYITLTTEDEKRHKVWYKSTMWLASAQQCADICHRAIFPTK